MKARLPKGYGRPDPNAMMRQVQKMQDDIRAKQEELEAKEYTGTASGEMVTVTMNGKHEITAVKIKPEAVDPDDIEMLEDLIAAASTALLPRLTRTRGGNVQDDRRSEHSRPGLRGTPCFKKRSRWKIWLTSSPGFPVLAAKAPCGWLIRSCPCLRNRRWSWLKPSSTPKRSAPLPYLSGLHHR